MGHRISKLDYVFLALIVSIVTLQPYFMHGAINFYETGLYLPQISEIFHGKVPYRDMFVLRGPLELFIPASMMQLFGKHIGMLNAYFYFGTVLTLMFYAIFALKIFKTRGFAYLFTLVLIARTFPRVTFSVWGGIRFGFGILAIFFSVIFLKTRKSLWLFFAGVVSGLALWTSPEIGAFSFISIVAMLFALAYLEKDLKSNLRYVFFYILGGTAASFPFLVYFYLNGALIPFVSTMKSVLISHCKTDVFDPALCFETPKNFKEFLLSFSPLNHNFKYTLPFFVYAYAAIYLFRRFTKRAFSLEEISLIPLFIYGAFLYKAAFRDIEGPQYRMALQPTLLLMFFYLELIFIGLKRVRQRTYFKKILVSFLVVLIPLYAISFSVYKYNKRFFIAEEIKSLVLNREHAAIPYSGPEPSAIEAKRAKGRIVPGHQAKDIDRVVRYISSNTGEGEAVFTFPDLGTYNFLTDRQPLGRFYAAEISFMHPDWFQELMNDLKNKRPRYVIFAAKYLRLEQFRPTVGRYLDEVESYLDKNYEIVNRLETVNIFRIKD